MNPLTVSSSLQLSTVWQVGVKERGGEQNLLSYFPPNWKITKHGGQTYQKHNNDLFPKTTKEVFLQKAENLSEKGKQIEFNPVG